MKFMYTKKQFNALEGLAYRIADNAYMLERYGADGAAVELKENDKTIRLLFAELDRLSVPFWVQNTIIAFADDWRRYKSEYLDKYLLNKNIVPAM